MNIDIKLSEGAALPTNAHETDTGYDVIAASGPVFIGVSHHDGGWRRIDYIEYDTGIAVAPEVRGALKPDNSSFHRRLYGYLRGFPRSSISKTNLILCNSVAVVDHAYRGTIKVRFKYIWQVEDLRTTRGEWGGTGFRMVINEERIYRKGDKILQLEPAWKESIIWRQVDTLDDTARGTGGFGSTDAAFAPKPKWLDGVRPLTRASSLDTPI